MNKILSISLLISSLNGFLIFLFGAPTYMGFITVIILFNILFFGFFIVERLKKISKKLGIEDETKDEKAAVVEKK